MNDKNTISDELLTKFLCGKTTPEETELVMAYMAESDENIEDLKNICAAIEMQKDVEKVAPCRSPHKFLWIISSAAAAVAAIVICIVAFNRGNETGCSPMIVEQTDTVKFKPQFQDTAVAIEEIETEDASKREHPTMPNEFVPIQPAVESKHYAGEMAKVNYVSLLFPYKDVHYISTDRKTINFQWDSDAIGIHLTVMDLDDNLLLDKQITDDDHFLWKLPPIEENVFFWKMIFTFKDGSTKTKQGRIQDEHLIIDE